MNCCASILLTGTTVIEMSHSLLVINPCVVFSEAFSGMTALVMAKPSICFSETSLNTFSSVRIWSACKGFSDCDFKLQLSENCLMSLRTINLKVSILTSPQLMNESIIFFLSFLKPLINVTHHLSSPVFGVISERWTQLLILETNKEIWKRMYYFKVWYN